MKQLSKEGFVHWKKHIAHMREFRELAMKLMAHPDVTPEQLWDVHTRLVNAMQEHNKMVPLVRERWPRYGTFVDL